MKPPFNMADFDGVLVQAHHAGLFSNINKVISFMELHDNVVVDWRAPDCIYGDPEDGNIWDHLFESHAGKMKPGRWLGTDFYPHERYTFANVAALYGDQDFRNRLSKQWRKLIIREDVIRQYSITVEHPYATVMVRAHGHAGEQVTKRSQALEDYEKVMRDLQRSGIEVFYLMCGDVETVRWFTSRFPLVMYNAKVMRSESRDVDRHLVEHQTVEDAKACLAEVMIAASGSALIHPVSNMATAALCLNPDLKSFYLP